MTEIAFPAIMLTVVGVAAPFVINLVVKAVSESWARYLIAVGLSAVTAFVGILLLGIDLTLTSVAIVVPSFITLVQIAWKLWWHAILKK